MIGILVLLLLLVPSWASATQRPAASCSRADIQAVIDAGTTVAGDEVTVPAGNCEWFTPVVIDGNIKPLTITGNGVGNTVITDSAPDGSGPSNGGLLLRNCSPTNFLTASGFTFIRNALHQSGGTINVGGVALGQVCFRVHHVAVTMPTAGAGAGITVFSAYGLIDHYTCTQTAASGVTAHCMEYWGESSSNFGGVVAAGYQSWARPSSIGTANNLFLEDSTLQITTGMAGGEVLIDGFYGARMVIRHNTFINGHPGWHGTDSSGRSAVGGEVYDNIWINNSAVTLRALVVRGGSAMVYNNKFNGTKKTTNGFNLQYFRVNAGSQISAWNVCNGTNWEVNGLTQNQNAAISALATSTTGGFRFNDTNKEVLGAEGGSNNTYFDGAGAGGYPCRDQPGRGPGQVLAPVFAWNNTSDEGNDIPQLGTFDAFDQAALDALVVSGRDYYNNTDPNTVGFPYTPYPYPHQLQGGGTPQRFAPGINLRRALYDPSLFEFRRDGFIHLVSQ
jgi:hypothetical protein